MKLGIMGGTFNPPHVGHLIIASEVYSIFELARLIFIPAGDPPHKENRQIIEAPHRIEMIRLAIWKDSRFEVSDIELKRKGKSYTIDTIRQIREFYGKEVEIYFIAGTDSALDLPTWREPLKILSLVHFVAVKRPGFPLRRLDKQYKRRIIPVEHISLNISSSDIRRRIREGRPIKYLVPEAVEEYIRKNKLYL